MEIAKSLYRGGEVIRADDKFLSYSSYRQLGLRCYFCGEPVCLRKGGIRKPHFAHFPSINPEKFEECILRQAKHNDSSYYNWYDLIEGRNQRLEAFQRYFLDILANHINDFKVDLPLITNHTFELSNEVLELLRSRKKAICRYFKIVRKDLPLLHRTIGCEALDYLTKSW
jgi:hypothetical protein